VVGTLTTVEISLPVLEVVGLELETIPLEPNVMGLAVLEGELGVVELLETTGSKRLVLVEAAAEVTSEVAKEGVVVVRATTLDPVPTALDPVTTALEPVPTAREDVVVGRITTLDPVPTADDSTVSVVESGEVVASVVSVEST